MTFSILAVDPGLIFKENEKVRGAQEAQKLPLHHSLDVESAIELAGKSAD
jgi:hypothetical protein